VALFRKNSLFVDSLGAGERYATLLTVLLNCELAGANPHAYLVDVIDKVAAGWPSTRADELLPRAWLAARQAEQPPQARLPSSPSRSSSRVTRPLSHPPRHHDAVVDVEATRRPQRSAMAGTRAQTIALRYGIVARSCRSRRSTSVRGC